MNEQSGAPRLKPETKSWVTAALPDVMTHADATMRVAYLCDHISATCFFELTDEETWLNAFVLQTSESVLIDLKQRVARLLLEATDAAAYAVAAPRRNAGRSAR